MFFLFVTLVNDGCILYKLWSRSDGVKNTPLDGTAKV